MPAVVVPIAQFVVSAAGALGVSSVGGLLAASYVGLGLGYAAVGALLNTALNALAPKPKTGAGRGLEVTVTDSAADGRILYGRVRISGVNVIPPLSSGSSGRYLHQVLALAVHEVDSYESVYFNQEEIPNSSIGAVTGSDSDGAVSTGTYAGAAWIRRYRGTATQTVDYILNAAFPSAFTSDFRGRGIAYVALRYDWGKGKVFTSGVPTVTAIVRGKRCYDPRLDTSPGANPTNASYIAWTSNPALIWADYIMADYGFAEPASTVDWDSVVSAANVCDALVNIPGGGTQARYTFNGVLLTNVDPYENLKAIVNAMMGKMAYSNGKRRVFAGAWRAPEFSIAQSDWLRINAVQTTAPRDASRFNAVVTYIVDPDRNWQRTETYRRVSETYKSADGGERIYIEMEQPHCTNRYEGQRKGEFLLRQSRNGVKVAGSLPPRFMKLRTWDNVSVTFAELGWNGKTFTVAVCTPKPDGSVDVVLVEEQSSDWTDLSASEYDAPSTSALPSTNPTAPAAPDHFSLQLIGNTILAEWTSGSVVPAGTIYQLWAAPFSLSHVDSKTLIREGDFTAMTLPLATSSPYWYQVRAIANSAASPFVPSTYGLNITYTPPPSGSWGLSVAPSPALGFGYEDTQQTPYVTVTVNNSNAPTFAWTRTTSVGISISNSTANVVLFSAGGLAVGETREVTWRCTVIDGANSSYVELTTTLGRIDPYS